MARLLQQLIGKTKSFNTYLFKRFNVIHTHPISAIKSKLNITSSKRPFSSITLQLSSLDLPFITKKDHSPFTNHEHHKDKKTQNENENDGQQFESREWQKFSDSSSTSTSSKAWRYLSYTLGLYLCTELLFYIRCKYLEYYANNKISVDIVRPTISHQRCEHLLDLALKYAGMYDNGGFEGWLKLWFMNAMYIKI